MNNKRRKFTSGLLVLSAVLLASSALGSNSDSFTPLRHDRDQVEAEHLALSQLPPAAARARYAGLDPAEQQDVWTVHLQQFLFHHPELSAKQRAVIYEGLGILSSGILQTASSEEKSSLLAQLHAASLEVLGNALAHEALEELGQPNARLPVLDPRLPLARAESTTNEKPYCTCSGASDFCYFGAVCEFHLNSCVLVQGCGTLWQYWCDGCCDGNCG